MQNDMANRMIDENGKLKSFSKWVKDTEDIRRHYVRSWLKTEYNTAILRAHQAADWKQFEAEKDILPNLEWMPSTSAVPGDDHIGFWNTILPVDDPFWNSHKPGDRWNCKCSLRANDKEINPPKQEVFKNPKNKPMPGLENNPGKDAKLFSSKNAYQQKAYSGAKQAVAEFLEMQKIEKPEVFETKKYKSGGTVENPTVGKQNKNEAAKNKKVYTELAKIYGEKYRLLPVNNEKGVKNPDALNLVTKQKSDAKIPVTDNGKNAIQSSIKGANTQKVQEVVIYLEKDYSMYDIRMGLKNAFMSNRAKNIKSVIIRFNSGNIKKYNADNLRKVFSKTKNTQRKQ
jgi:hypothetical protein